MTTSDQSNHNLEVITNKKRPGWFKIFSLSSESVVSQPLMDRSIIVCWLCPNHTDHEYKITAWFCQLEGLVIFWIVDWLMIRIKPLNGTISYVALHLHQPGCFIAIGSIFTQFSRWHNQILHPLIKRLIQLVSIADRLANHHLLRGDIWWRSSMIYDCNRLCHRRAGDDRST